MSTEMPSHANSIKISYFKKSLDRKQQRTTKDYSLIKMPWKDQKENDTAYILKIRGSLVLIETQA